MFKLTSNIVIDKYTFLGVVSLEINSSWDLLTDTCIITVPGKTEFEGENIASLIKRGMEVSIELGYDDTNNKVFKGFVKSVKADVPITIECEDNMFLLKENTLSKSYPASTSLQTILNDVAIDFNHISTELNLGKLRLNKVSSAKVLNELKTDFVLVSYFVDDTLFVGVPYWSLNQSEHYFKFQKNIIENNLTYMVKEDIKIKIVAISIDDDNTKTEVQAGDDDGEQRTFYYYNISKSDLETLANNELEKSKYDGYRGSFTTFGSPQVKHGDIVNLKDDKYNRVGKYLVKSVTTNFGIEGFRQEIELDRTYDN